MVKRTVALLPVPIQTTPVRQKSVPTIPVSIPVEKRFRVPKPVSHSLPLLPALLAPPVKQPVTKQSKKKALAVTTILAIAVNRSWLQ